MTFLELRDIGAGVVARSNKLVDCIEFLNTCIRRKQQDVADLEELDPSSAAMLTAELHRLQALLSILKLRNQDLEC